MVLFLLGFIAGMLTLAYLTRKLPPGGCPVPAVPLIEAWQDWCCPNGCGTAERTPPLPPNASRYHVCSRLHSLTAPLVRAGTDCTVRAVEREDYLNGEIQATGDDGRPYMAVRTDYADGRNDIRVHAPAARMRFG